MVNGEVKSDDLAKNFIDRVIANNNSGVLLDELDLMKKTKFCGIPKLFLAKKLGRTYGILLYETQVIERGKKIIRLYIDSDSAVKLGVEVPPPEFNPKMAKCYIGADVLTYDQVNKYKTEHELQRLPPDLIQIVENQKEIDAIPDAEKVKVSFFIEPSAEQLAKREFGFMSLLALRNGNRGNGNRGNGNGSRSRNRGNGNGNRGNGSRNRGNGSRSRGNGNGNRGLRISEIMQGNSITATPIRPTRNHSSIMNEIMRGFTPSPVRRNNSRARASNNRGNSANNRGNSVRIPSFNYDNSINPNTEPLEPIYDFGLEQSPTPSPKEKKLLTQITGQGSRRSSSSRHGSTGSSLFK